MTHGTSTDQAQPSPAVEPWPEGVLARYLTPAGQFVDITYSSRLGWVYATCGGCGTVERTDTGGYLDDPPEKETERVDQVLPESRELAQAHAEKCRALPRPGGDH